MRPDFEFKRRALLAMRVYFKVLESQSLSLDLQRWEMDGERHSDESTEFDCSGSSQIAGETSWLHMLIEVKAGGTRAEVTHTDPADKELVTTVDMRGDGRLVLATMPALEFARRR